jgi:hypothetical protein
MHPQVKFTNDIFVGIFKAVVRICKWVKGLFFITLIFSCNNNDNISDSVVVTPIPSVRQDSPSIKETNDTTDYKLYSKNFIQKFDILRKEYTGNLRTQFLRMGLDVKCIVKEKKGKKILILKNAIFNDAWLQKIQDENIIIEALGYYDRVILSDGYEYQSASY